MLRKSIRYEDKTSEQYGKNVPIVMFEGEFFVILHLLPTSLGGAALKGYDQQKLQERAIYEKFKQELLSHTPWLAPLIKQAESHLDYSPQVLPDPTSDR